MRRLFTVLVIGLPMQGAHAQTGSVVLHRAAVDEIVQSVEAEFACRMTIHGEPHHEDFSRQWAVAYSASGEDCDEASDELRRHGAELDLLFFRKPNRDQLHALLLGMTSSVGAAFGCRIDIRGEPRLDESTGRWFVSYLASGNTCDAASQELGRRGAELDLVLMRWPTPDMTRRLLE